MNNLLSLIPFPCPFVGSSSTVSTLFLMAITLLVFLWLAFTWARRQAMQLSQVWQDLAEELEFSYKPSRGPLFRRQSEEIEGVIDGAIIHLTCYGLAPGLDSPIYTRWSVEGNLKSSFVLYLHHRHVLSPLAEALGYEDLRLGDPGFDAEWSVKTDHLAEARDLLEPPLRTLIRKLRHGVILLNDTGLNIVWSGRIQDRNELKAGLDVLVAILHRLGARHEETEEEEEAPESEKERESQSTTDAIEPDRESSQDNPIPAAASESSGQAEEPVQGTEPEGSEVPEESPGMREDSEADGNSAESE